ncbi:MAG: hypothetical protein CW691_09055 [Candidatus Bathyarchaeum sp.]|nr:MAG: hypothetical protein CW691_09055 [Candidatus Bathyarchaeum sp.]
MVIPFWGKPLDFPIPFLYFIEKLFLAKIFGILLQVCGTFFVGSEGLMAFGNNHSISCDVIVNTLTNNK